MEARKNKKHKLTRRSGPIHKGKVCQGKCKERLTLKSFAKNPGWPDGLETMCRDCRASYQRDRKETKLKSDKRYRRSIGIVERAGTHRKMGWESRIEELLATGEIKPRRRRAALKRKDQMRLVCGRLCIVPPKKKKRQ